MIHTAVILIKAAYNIVRKISKLQANYKDCLSATDPASIIIRSIHVPKGGASTSVRGNVLFNVTLGIVGCNVVVKSYFQLCAQI